jgi:hypothetical protein
VRGSQAQDWFSFLYLGFECLLREFGVTQTTWCFIALPMCPPKEFEETVMTTVVGFGAGNAQFDPQTATRERRTQAPKGAMTMRTSLISALITAIPAATATAADVPFLQAAIYFFLGLEPPHVTMATETKPGVKEKATLPSGTIFLVPEDEPCKVQWLASRQLNSPKQEMILIDFAKIPSPRAMTRSRVAV